MTRAVTQWFKHDEKPLRRGSYEVRNDGTLSRRNWRYLTLPRFRYWSGKEWLCWPGGPPSVMGTHSSHQWRGLA